MIKTGVIIAAGQGTRLADGSHLPKPLRKVGGMTLLKRIILSSAKAGLTRIVVVVGFDKEKIIDYIASQKWPIQVETVENTEWKKANGVSVLTAEKVVSENFALLMSDHIFDPNTLKEFAQVDMGTDSAKLAIDYKVQQVFDKDDATKVVVKNGRIQKIDKALIEYNAVDTGMFMMTPDIFRALRASMKNSDCSLSDAIRLLGQENKMGVFDIKGGYWQDVDTKPCIAHAEKILLNACRKSTDGFISRNFNRHLSILISTVLLKTPLTANMATFLISLIGLFCGYLASLGDLTAYAWAGVLFNLTSILDGVDGELSKVRMTQSQLGAWLDTASDNLTYVVFTVGTAVGLYRVNYESVDFLVPFAVIGITLLILIMVAYTAKFSKSGSLLAVQSDLKASSESSKIKKVFLSLYFVIKRDFFATLFMFLAIFGKPHWILFLIGLATNIAWVIVAQKFIQKLRQPAT